jgi:hypothetical protein
MKYFRNNSIKKSQMTEEQKKQMLKVIGVVAGIFSKAILESQGMIVDYKINGEDITKLEKLHELDITERIKLAVDEERYEDAANLKKILDKYKGIN